MITLRHLRYFEALSRHRHFRRAAEECSVTQPALSMQMQEFEALLGTVLIERRRGDVQLTEMGHEVARRAREILVAARDLMEYARTRQEVLSGPLQLGIIPSIAPYVLPRILPEITEAYPALSLNIRETLTAQLLDELVAGRVDVVLMSLPIDHPDVDAVPLFDDNFLLAMPASEEMPAHQRPQPEALDLKRLLLLEEGHCLREQALTFCGMPGATQRQQFGASSLATIVQLVANGYGLTLVPEIAVPVEVGQDARIRLVRFADPEPYRTIGLAWRRSSSRRRDFEALAAIIRQVAGQILTDVKQREREAA